MGIGLTREEYEAEQAEWEARIDRIAEAIRVATRAPDRISIAEMYEIINENWEEDS